MLVLKGHGGARSSRFEHLKASKQLSRFVTKTMSEKVTIALPGLVFDFSERAKHTPFGQILLFENIQTEI
jgi:hypothetical protein